MVKSLLLPWRFRQRSPLDRRMEQETRGRRERGGRDWQQKGWGQTPHSVLIGQIWVTLPVWNANEKSCFGPPLLCSPALLPLDLPWACRVRLTSIQKWCRISGKTASKSGQKEERGYEAHANGKATSSLLLGTGCHGWHEGRRVCLCVGTPEVSRSH